MADVTMLAAAGRPPLAETAGVAGCAMEAVMLAHVREGPAPTPMRSALREVADADPGRDLRAGDDDFDDDDVAERGAALWAMVGGPAKARGATETDHSPGSSVTASHESHSGASDADADSCGEAGEAGSEEDNEGDESVVARAPAAHLPFSACPAHPARELAFRCVSCPGAPLVCTECTSSSARGGAHGGREHRVKVLLRPSAGGASAVAMTSSRGGAGGAGATSELFAPCPVHPTQECVLRCLSCEGRPAVCQRCTSRASGGSHVGRGHDVRVCVRPTPPALAGARQRRAAVAGAVARPRCTDGNPQGSDGEDDATIGHAAAAVAAVAPTSAVTTGGGEIAETPMLVGASSGGQAHPYVGMGWPLQHIPTSSGALPSAAPETGAAVSLSADMSAHAGADYGSD